MIDNKMPGDWLFKAVPIFIGVVFVIVIAAWILMGVLAVKTVNSLDGCTPALVQSQKDGQSVTSIECKK